jgi:hypothetical protein
MPLTFQVVSFMGAQPSAAASDVEFLFAAIQTVKSGMFLSYPRETTPLRKINPTGST